MSNDALTDLARKAGLETQWRDVQGREHIVSPDTLRKVLAALDLSADSAAQISDSSAKIDEQARATPPLLTAWAGETAHCGGTTITAPGTPGYHSIEIAGQARTL